MKPIERLKRAARSDLSTSELFSSRHIHSFLLAKLLLICRAFKIGEPDLRVLFDPNSPMTAMTSTSQMYINLGHKMFDGTDEQRLLKGSGVLLHEVGHLLFTNYTAWIKWMTAISQGTWWPHVPDVPPELENARDLILEIAEHKRFKRVFMDTAHGLSNTNEDGRIENFILKFVRNVRFMMKGLVLLRQETYAECPAFEDIAAKVDSGEWNPIGAMLQLVVHYARFGEVKGTLDPNHPLGEAITKIMPQIDVYLDAKEAVVYYDAFNKMLVYLEPFLEDAYNQMKQEAEKQQGAGIPPMGMPGDGASSDGSGQSGSGSSSPSGSSNQSGSEDEDGSQDGSQNGDAKSDGSQNGDSQDSSQQGDAQNGDPQQGNGNSQPDGSQGNSGGMFGDSPLSDEEISEALTEMLREALKQLVGMTVDNQERMDERAKGSDRGAVARRIAALADGSLSGLANGEGGKVVTENAAGRTEGSGNTTHAEAVDTGDAKLTLEDIRRKLADEKTEQLASSAVKDEYQTLANQVKDYAEIHKDRDITVYHYGDVSEDDKRLYDEISREIAPLVKRAVKSSNFYEKDREPVERNRLFCGKLDSRRVHRQDGRMFKKTKYFDEPPIVALAIRVDCSGSMSGRRIKAAQRTCIFLYEYALGMAKKYNVNIPIYVYGDCVGRDAHGVNMYVFADPKYATPNEKYRLMRMAAGGCNRDGLPIRMAVKRLEEECPDASKVLFNITDGQPNDRDYGGEEAFNDLRDITKHCERKHIALAACAIGDDRETIEHIYGSEHFLNISDLDELPLRLVKILKKLLK